MNNKFDFPIITSTWTEQHPGFGAEEMVNEALNDLSNCTATALGPKSYQPIGVDLTVDAAAGKGSGDTAQLGPIMGNIHGATLTKTGNYLFGVQGAYSITGNGSSTYPKGAVLAQIADGSTDADGAVVAFIDGDSAVTKAGAAFKVRKNNSQAGSDFDFGLDLFDAAHDGYNAVGYGKGEIRLLHEACVFTHAGVPDATVGAGVTEKGSLCIDITNANVYVNAGSKAVPSWKLVTRAA